MSISLAAAGSITFTSLDSSGSISVPGLKVGDMMAFCYCPATNTQGMPPNNTFEGIITVVDEIQQIANLGPLGHTFTWTMFFFRTA